MSKNQRLELKMPKQMCASCSMALRRFLGHAKGVKDIQAEADRVSIEFDPSELSQEELLKLSREALQKLGYRLQDI